MSSFIHSSKHFNSVETGLIDLKRKAGSSSILYNVSNTEITSVMDGIRELSVNSVCIQYGHDNNDILNNVSYLMSNKKDYINLSPVGLIKAMDSILYQIELHTIKRSRDITEREQQCYNRFIEFKNQLANYIIGKLPEYDEVKTWCIG